MKEVGKIIESLHPLERAVLPVLRDNITLAEIVDRSGLKEVEAMRALQWLENKDAVRVKKESKEIISLDKNGEIYVKKGLPEKRFLVVLEKPLKLDEVREKASLDDDELNISLGVLKKKNAIKISDKVEITEKGRELIVKDLIEEQFLKSLPRDLSRLTDEEKRIFFELKKRKNIIKTDLIKSRIVGLTELGRKVISSKIEKNLINALTPQMLKEESWKDKKFRRFDVEAEVPRIYAGKRHIANQAINFIRRIWLDLGFKEMEGRILDTSFWNFDSLFVPQDHPARELQDTFFVDGKGNLPQRELVERVKKTHENGWNTESKGWQYKWDEERAKELVLRTHTTILSARTIASLKKNDLPAKYFSVGKVFRNEALDWSHLFEFYQSEGIVVDENVNFSHLLGYLKKFFEKMGFEKIRLRPAYFPYTEMSCEVIVFHPVHKKWVELGGSGIFRPEVVKPLLGIDVPVLAWGLGLERIIMDKFDIKDLREIYLNDLKKLRESKAFSV